MDDDGIDIILLNNGVWKNVKDKIQAGAAQLYDTINFQIKLYESTNEISEIDGDDGEEPMRVCFFPTNKMKIWFRILEDMHAVGSVKN
jgi:hypothetical protein